MDPKPDYGYDTYKGYGRLKDKVKCPVHTEFMGHNMVVYHAC
jgi:hypothetical protein